MKQKLVTFLVLFSFLANNAFATYNYSDCGNIDKNNLRDELNSLCQGMFNSEVQNIKISNVIEQQWNKMSMDSIINREVETAVSVVKKRYPYWERLWSSWSSEKAKKMSEEVAAVAFGSENFRKAIESLSSDIADSLFQNLQTTSANSATSAFMCLQEFIGNTYSSTIVTVFQNEVKKETQNLEIGEVGLDTSFAVQHTKALGGLGVIVVSQIVKKVSQKILQKISQRIAGRIASRVLVRGGTSTIPIVGWIIGGGMIVWDLISGADGAFPDIEEALKDDSIKLKIKSEIENEVQVGFFREIPEIAREIANEIYSKWIDFRKKFSEVLSIAEDNYDFKLILDDTSPDNFYKLANLVNIIYHKIGKPELEKSIQDGSFKQAMILPEKSFIILETTKSISVLNNWGDIAGNSITKVVEFEIYKQKSPEFFDKQSLENLVALDDKALILKLTELSKESIDSLLTVSTVNLKKISTNYNTDDLKDISWYLSRLSQDDKNLLVSHLLTNPDTMEKLKDEKVKTYITGSKNPQEVINYALIPSQYSTVLSDCMKIFGSDNISASLFFYKYNNKLILIIFGILFVLFLLFAFIKQKLVGFMNVFLSITKPFNKPGKIDTSKQVLWVAESPADDDKGKNADKS